MNYFEYRIKADEAEQEILIALLSDFPFNSFSQDPKHLLAFIQEKDLFPATEGSVHSLLQSRNHSFERNHILHTNWNARWESEFNPIIIPGKCLVRAPFHDPNQDLPIEIIIQPKMAFGTGHHSTTFLMMDRMFEHDLKGMKVLDYGCGTGILSILASKLGSKEVLAVDNDPLAIENCLEQLEMNAVQNVKVLQLDTPGSDNQTFNCILANINRNVLQSQMEALSNRILPEGILLISGILEQDADVLETLIIDHGFEDIQRIQKDEWICIEAKKIYKE